MRVVGSVSRLSADIRSELGDALFATVIRHCRERADRPILVTLCGAQGSGKSTTAERLRRRLEADGRSVAVRSLDDFYLTHAERMRLSRDIHPLLATRGVPGTHDVALLSATLDALKGASVTSRIPLPSFDKATDDRVPRERWPVWVGPADIILLEGWCVGAAPQPADFLVEPVNNLERAEDADGAWRRYVNDCLAGDYAALFAGIDLRLMICAPDFGCVQGWRTEQEAGLSRDAAGAAPALSAAAMRRFISHYERITRWLMADRPADLIAMVGRDRIPLSWHAEAA
jgi:D-glycerate 3-kinase